MNSEYDQFEYNMFSKIIHIYISIDTFIDTNPPCKKCLIRGICIQDYQYCISIKKCNEFNEFIENSNLYKPVIINMGMEIERY